MLRKLRLAAGLTQSELSAMTGISCENICRYETGARKPPIDVVVKLAAALGCTLDELVKETA